MSLDCSERYIDNHWPDISYTQKYTDEEGWSYDKTKEKYTGEMEYNPYGPIDTYDIKKIF